MLTTALENASPSPALLIEPWEPPLKARKPKSRMRKPRQTKGMEWPGIPPVFVHLSVLVGKIHVISLNSSYNFKIDQVSPCPEDNTARQRENRARQMNNGRAGKVSESPEESSDPRKQ